MKRLLHTTIRHAMAAVILFATTLFSGSVGLAEPPSNKNASATPHIEFTPAKGSRVELDGTTNVGTWNSLSTDVSGKVLLDIRQSTLEALFDRIEKTPPDVSNARKPDLILPVAEPTVAHISLPVASLQSNSKGMDRDLHKALKAQQYPTIDFTFQKVESAEIKPAPDGGTVLHLRIVGDMTMAGTQREVPLELRVQRLSPGCFSVNARTTVLMTDFGVTPPSKLFGLIKARDSVTVNCDFDSTVTDAPPAPATRPGRR